MNAVFWPMHQLGIEGMPRRYHTYSVDSWTELNSFISLSALIMGAAQFILAWNLIKSYKYGEESGKDPWGGWSLEWTTTSPLLLQVSMKYQRKKMQIFIIMLILNRAVACFQKCGKEVVQNEL